MGLLWLGLGVVPGCGVGWLSPGFLIASEAYDRIDEAAREFNNSLRFGNIERALPFVAPDARSDFLVMFGTEGNGPVRFTEVDIRDISFGPESDEARVLVVTHFYRPPGVSVVTLQYEQVWRYDPDRFKWYVHPDLELFRAKKVASPTIPPASPGR